MSKKIIALFLTAVILLSGCSAAPSEGGETAVPTASPTVEPEPSVSPTEEPAPSASQTAEPEPSADPTAEPTPDATEEPAEAKYEFNPHLYVPILADDVPQDYWDSFHNLCDALRAGETTFECSSEAAYKWATDPATLNQLFPAACTKIKSESDDGSAPFENGVGNIYYQMPADEFVQRQTRFEELITYTLSLCIEPDDSDFEKCLKLYDYASYSYVYEEDFVEHKSDGACYLVLTTGIGQCVDLASAFSYLLMQAGVEALQVGGHSPNMDHAWTYLVIDGKGYYSDPTWGLRSAADGDPLALYYFLMDGERRANDGFDLEDLTAPLLPKYWEKFSSVRFTADDDEYCFPSSSFLISIDDDNDTVRYRCDGEEREFRYAR